jgi:hypothetical protein
MDRTMNSPNLYFSLIEACEQPGCPACRLVHRFVEQYLDKLFYEAVNDRTLRHQLRLSRGFCNPHAWQAQEYGDVLGIAIIYQDILGNVLKSLPAGSSQTRSKSWLDSLRQYNSRSLGETIKKALLALTPKEACPACQQRDSSTELVLSVLIESLPKDGFIDSLAASDGLCLPHLRQTFERMRPADVFYKLLDVEREKLEGLRAELGEFIRKSDYRFREESLGSERDAARRAVAMAIGSRPEKHGD